MKHRKFGSIILATTFLVGLGVVYALAQEEQIDWAKAKQIHEKFVRGEKLTDEEQAYHDRAAKAIQARAGKQTDDGIDWDRARRLHEKFVGGEKLTDEEQAYHDRAARALRAKGGKQADGGIDWEKANRIHQKFMRGEKLTEEERAYHDKATKAMQAQRQPPPAKPPTGLKPLTDMTAKDRYKDQDGGLYGGGKNEPPEEHLQAVMQQAKLIRSLDGDGKPAEDGKIVLISIGMSNTTQEFSQFIPLANADPAKSPKLVIVDGAQGGQTANIWANPGARNPWEVLDQRLKQAGVTAQQVQVAWIKQAMPAPEFLGAFPKHAEVLKEHMVGLLNQLKERFPNVRLAYLSSRIYGGYATTKLNPEPYAYESAFTVRWLIQDQIDGKPEAVKSPLLLWGPYLWADGEKGRKAGDLVWKPEDLVSDGTHPSDSGRRKVAELLLKFMKTDPTAKVWFVH